MFEPKLWTKPTNSRWFIKEITQYLEWLTTNKYFEGEINIFLTNAKFIYDLSARKREGNFLGPFDRTKVPSLYFSLGELFKDISQNGKDNTLCNWLQYLTFFLYSYIDWQKDREFDNDLNNDLANKMIFEYIDFKEISFESEDRRKKENRKRAKNKGKKKKRKKEKKKRHMKRIGKEFLKNK
ncbi:hypothetical protein [Lactococcus lactis]|uniref:hypothetical protein n=1 Tax=Lactococcus lactis TaxID=1358 RepID=UPI0018AAC357|nr:hypothetical protein [Lactococcus lactis]MDT2941566.1 hypothetical protein [Lactococcus lactis]